MTKEILHNKRLSRRVLLRAAMVVGVAGAVEAVNVYGKIFGLEVNDNDIDAVIETLTPQPYPSPYAGDYLVSSGLEAIIEQTPTSTPIPEPIPTTIPILIPFLTPWLTLEPTLLIPTPEQTPDTRYQASEVFSSGDRTVDKIYLTVDDCWIPANVETALNIAEKYGIKLTFFPVGNTINRAPSLYQEAVQRGHAIENHTWSHELLARLSASGIEYQIQKQHEAVQNAVGQEYSQYFLRPPGGSGILGGRYAPLIDVCERLGYKIAMWTSDSTGWKEYPKTDTETESRMLKSIFSNFFKGVILAQHALPNDMIALPTVIERAQANGWQMDTLRNGIK